jgi:hypothetical protein
LACRGLQTKQQNKGNTLHSHKVQKSLVIYNEAFLKL